MKTQRNLLIIIASVLVYNLLHYKFDPALLFNSVVGGVTVLGLFGMAFNDYKEPKNTGSTVCETCNEPECACTQN